MPELVVPASLRPADGRFGSGPSKVRREALERLNQIFESQEDFRPRSSSRVFRIMAADYAEATLIPALAKAMRTESPSVVLDFLTPSDVSYRDIELG